MGSQSQPAPGDRLRQIRGAAAEDEVVAGVVLHGSRGMEGFARPDSDYDVVVIVADAGGPSRPWMAVPWLDVWTISLDAWPCHAMPGRPDAWNRYALVHAKLLYEQPHSGVGDELERKRRLSQDEARVLARASLDEYVNGCYRSLKNHRDGRSLEARLDAAESLAPLLTAVFAMHHRVRPYNRHLIWELTQDPLPDHDLSSDRLLAGVQQLIAGGDAAAQRDLFAHVEQFARSHGCGEVIDSWEEKFPLLRP